MIYGILIVLIIVAPILLAYYFDYKSNPKEFEFSIKSSGKGLLKGIFYLLLFVGVNAIYKNVIPFNKNHGIEFNKERLSLGIHPITDNLKIIPEWSKQYKTVWYDDDSKNGHFKKVINYGIFNVNSEIDYYENENKKFTYVSRKYDFKKNTFEYFIEKQAETIGISKTEFEKFIAE